MFVVLLPVVPVSVGSGCEPFWAECTLEHVHSDGFFCTFDSPPVPVPVAPVLKSLATERAAVLLIPLVCLNSLHTGLSVHNKMPMGLSPVDTVHRAAPVHRQTLDIVV